MCGGLSNRLTKGGKPKNRIKGKELYTKSCSCGAYDIWLLPVATRPLAIMTDFQNCSVVAATALHGVILADALRVPAVWLGKHDPTRAEQTHGNEQLAAKSHPPWRYRKLADGSNESLARSEWGTAALRWNVSIHQTAFKYEDYFFGVGHHPVRAYSILEAIDLMRRNALAPRLTVAELLMHAKRFIRTFPFHRVCANVSAPRRVIGSSSAAVGAQQPPAIDSCGCSPTPGQKGKRRKRVAKAKVPTRDA